MGLWLEETAVFVNSLRSVKIALQSFEVIMVSIISTNSLFAPINNYQQNMRNKYIMIGIEKEAKIQMSCNFLTIYRSKSIFCDSQTTGCYIVFRA